MNDKQKALIFVLLTALIGGLTGAVTKIGLFEIPPISYAFVRFFLAALFIAPFFLSRKRLVKDIVTLMPLSLLGSINIFFYVVGIKSTTATIAQLLYAGVPLLTGLIGYYFLKHELTYKKTIGIIIGFLGVVLVILLPVLEKGNTFSGDLVGNLLIAIGVISYSFYTAYSKKALERFSPLFLTAAFIFTTTLALFPFFVFDSMANFGWWNDLTFSGLLSMIYIVFIATFAAYAFHQYAIKHGGSIFASMQFYLVPIFAYISASLLLGEQLTTGLIVGGTLALLGVYVTTKK